MRGLSLESAKAVLAIFMCPSSTADNSDDGSVLVLVLIVKVAVFNFLATAAAPVVEILHACHNILSIGNLVS
jgi:hypothetical protein